jgi:hypothetical protein
MNHFQAVNFLRVYLLPAIILAGSILNLLSFFVMRRMKSSTSFYFSILGLSDTLVLLSGGLNLWLSSTFNFYLIQFSKSVCKIFPFFTYTMLDFSVWLIVITTGEKLFAVSQPLYAHSLKMKTKKSVCIVILALFICSTMNSHFLITHAIIDFKLINQTENKYMINNIELKDLSICSFNKWNRFYEEYWGYIDATIYSFLPFSLISVFNVLVIIYLKRAENESKQLYQLENSITRNNYIFKIIKEKKVKDNDLNLYSRQNLRKLSLKNINKRLIVLIFLINTSFCILSSPMVILQIVLLKNNEEFNYRNKQLDLFLSIAEIFQYLNHTTNFFFYSLSVRTFRKQLKIYLKLFHSNCCIRSNKRSEK